jgi:putative transposase
MALRLVYLIFSQLAQWIVMMARESATKDAELLVLRHEVTVLRRQIARPRVDRADRMLLAGLAGILPRRIREARLRFFLALVAWRSEGPRLKVNAVVWVKRISGGYTSTLPTSEDPRSL